MDAHSTLGCERSLRRCLDPIHSPRRNFSPRRANFFDLAEIPSNPLRILPKYLHHKAHNWPSWATAMSFAQQ
jgi:hypothetical protein